MRARALLLLLLACMGAIVAKVPILASSVWRHPNRASSGRLGGRASSVSNYQQPPAFAHATAAYRRKCRPPIRRVLLHTARVRVADECAFTTDAYFAASPL